jgi:hypothetical protein
MVWTAAEIAENALRNIGVFSPYDISPDPEHFSIALSRLDSLVSYIVAIEELEWFEEIEQNLTLVAAQESYALNSLLSNDLQYISAIYRSKNGTDRTELNLLRLSGYEDVKEEFPNSVVPDYAFIMREENSTLYPWGIPDVGGYVFHIRGRRFPADLLTDKGNIATGFNKAWDLCLSNLLGVELGSGPIVTLPDGRLDRMLGIGTAQQSMLRSYNARANISHARFTEFHNL